MGLWLPWVAALVAVTILPGWSFYFDVIPKVALVLGGAAVALWTPRVGRAKWLYWILGAQAAAVVMSTAVSTNRWFSFDGSTWRRSGVLVELAILVLTAAALGLVEGRLREWLRIMVLTGLPAGIYAIFQYFGIDPLMDPAGYRFGEGRFMIVRPPGTFGHAAYLATYLLFAVFAGMALARMETAPKWKWAAWATSGAGVFAIFLSGTRAAVLGLIVGALFVAVSERINWKWLVCAAGIVIAAVGIFYFSPAGERLRARVFWSGEDRMGGARLLLWRDSLRMAESRWAFGYGPERFSLEFPRHESIELARAYPDFYHESPHNIFLDALDSEGVVGLAALAAMVLCGLMAAKGWLGGAFVAMLVSQQFTTFTVSTQLYFYLCAAILMGQKNGAAGLQASVASPLFLRLFSRFAAILFAGMAVWMMAGDLVLGSARRALDHGEAGRAAPLVDRAREMGMAADIYFSRRFLAAKVWPAAIHAASSAPETADDPQNALVNLAAFRATVNDAVGVELSLRQAIAVSPNWYKPHWLLAQVLELNGRMAEAKIEAQAAEDRDGRKHPEVHATWDRIRAR